MKRSPVICRRQSLLALISIALFAALGFGASAGVATAQPIRQIPAEARFGEFEILQYPEASIDDKTLRLGAGARIHDSRNMIVLPSTVTGKHAVLYQLDPAGQLSRIWILAPEELEAAKARSPGK